MQKKTPLCEDIHNNSPTTIEGDKVLCITLGILLRTPGTVTPFGEKTKSITLFGMYFGIFLGILKLYPKLKKSATLSNNNKNANKSLRKFFCRKSKKRPTVKGQSLPQELEEGYNGLPFSTL